MKKVIIAQLNVKAHKVTDFLKLAEVMVEHSNAESGCITYKLLKEVNAETKFFFYEEYENEKAIKIHNSSEHYITFIKSITPLLEEKPKVEVF